MIKTVLILVKTVFEIVDKAFFLPLTREVANAKHLTEGEKA